MVMEENNKMNVTWIIENYTKEQSFRELTEAVEKLGYPLLKIDGDYTHSMLANFKSSKKTCVMVNGTIKICKIIKDELKNYCSPIIYSDFEKYKCSNYYSYFGPYLFNDKYCIMSLKELERQKFDIWGHYGKESLIFIRPDSGDKPFQAGVLDFKDLAQFMDTHNNCHHDLVLVSTPKNIKWEGRFVVSKYKEIISQSTYRFQGLVTKIPAVPDNTLKLCQEILNKVEYYPDSVFCLDLCEDSDNTPWLLELTSFSSAGLYATDKEKIVKRVSEIVWEDFNYNEH